MIVLGIDLGTIRPSVATLDVADRRPAATVKSGNFRNCDKRVRPGVAMAWLQQRLTEFAEQGGRHAFLEDSVATGVGKTQRGKTNHRTTSLLTAQLHQLTGFAVGLGIAVEHIEPRTIGATLGFGSYPKTLTESQRRTEKKKRAKQWCSVHVDFEGKLTNDDADAITIAYAGWVRSKARRTR